MSDENIVNIDNTANGTGLFNAKIPGLSDAADIQSALRLYHYGSYTYDGANTNTGLLLTPSIAKHLQNLVEMDETKAPLENPEFTTGITTPNNTASRISFYYPDLASFPEAADAHGAIAHAHDTGKLYFAHAGQWLILSSEDYVDTEIENSIVDQSLLAGVGIDWNTDTDQFDISNSLLLVSAKEKIDISATPANGIVNVDIITSSVNVKTSNATGNYTINVRGDSTNTLNSLMSIGESLTVVFESPNGSTPYYAVGYTIDGNSVTPKWLGGTAPSAGNASATDLYMLQIRKTANATFTCLASLSKFA